MEKTITIEGFTPGPWSLSPNETYVRAKGRHGWNIATIEVQPPYTEANAKLIAAAPDLFAACKEFVRKVEAGEAKSSKSYEQMKAAIKKATD